jgi:hypothetical protein
MQACANFVKLSRYLSPMLTRAVRNQILFILNKSEDLFHNHKPDGRVFYRYPKVQYKVINGKICVLGIGEEATQKVANLQIPYTWELDGCRIRVKDQKIFYNDLKMSEGGDYIYDFITPWVAMNQKNFQKYQELGSEKEKKEFLEKLLRNELISVAKGIQYQIKERISVTVFRPKSVKVPFKDTFFMGMYLSFRCNLNIPSLLGIGRCVSHGFGTIKKVWQN